ncbi:protein TIC 21, chloroplastic-like [Ipomoea triloba]|uniref:protein TIC 21, chloroplastic-like n=1 Tax=Ipomoea triloba TaxID=35885 RepID=UPI00125DFBEA|nr:protein TIC 21, chloroplastic-like [Ipomoea triloba]
MQTLLLPAARSGGALPPLPMVSPVASKPSPLNLLHHPKSSPLRLSLTHTPTALQTQHLLSPPHLTLNYRRFTVLAATNAYPSDDSEKAKLAQVAKRLESTSRYFKKLGGFGFWGQLVCTVVAAGILSLSAAITGKITSPFTFYSTAAGIVAAFVSVFWSFGYLRLSEKLKKTANDPSKAPPRADVVKSLKNGIGLNLFGMGATVIGMQATVGLLVAKAITTSANPYYQGGSTPLVALDVFLVQASANTILSHFIGLLFSLLLLHSVTLSPTEGIPVPKVA